jgi:ATP-dependent protease ClpP protease subunit
LNVKEDWILSGEQAVEYGFADVLIRGKNSVEALLKKI